eukprot:9484813-Pyramimonas_sp.AAC.1
MQLKSSHYIKNEALRQRRECLGAATPGPTPEKCAREPPQPNSIMLVMKERVATNPIRVHGTPCAIFMGEKLITEAMAFASALRSPSTRRFAAARMQPSGVASDDAEPSGVKTCR